MADAEDGPAGAARADEVRRLSRLVEHGAWADRALLGGLRRAERARGRRAPEAESPVPGADDFAPDAPIRDAWREYAHVLAAQELWLSRLEGRDASVSVWPDLSADACEALGRNVASGYAELLRDLTPAALVEGVRYTNSAGSTFTTPVGDILLHVVLHGQYHRGKVNLLLRRMGAQPVPTDYIGFVRGAPAARTTVER